VLDHCLNSSEYYLAEESYSLLEKIYESKSDIVNFDKCILSDEVRNIEITRAINQIESGEAFAFYNLGFSEEERELLSKVGIEEFNDITINTSISKLKELKQEVSLALIKMQGVNIFEIAGLSNLITRLVSVVIGELQAEEYELRIRSRESYQSEEDCLYWHLDKSEEEILGNSNNVKEKRFIMVLKGEGTVYQAIGEEQREVFMKVAKEAPYYYGHGLEGCKTNDEINQLFRDQEKVATKEQYGSVHMAGSNGAMHAAPKESEGRLIILLTPKINSIK
jgi:hypothetical protein